MRILFSRYALRELEVTSWVCLRVARAWERDGVYDA